ncbi:carbonate dehydratase [Thozetella sp. PMI_491]|nr:carbonate dehydratase [Thozetella sp. PMI_491]
MTVSGPPRYTLVPCPRDLIPRDDPKKQQVLWIGCSDSCFEETTILDLSPDETIVLRNIGNMIVEDDLSCASMVEYAMNILQVKHIVICGHYGCGIVKTTCSDHPSASCFCKLDDERMRYRRYLDAAPVEHKDELLVELNVVQQMQDARSHPEIARAVGERGVEIHGLVFDRSTDRWVQLVLA